MDRYGYAVVLQKLEHGCGMISAGVPSFFDLGSEEGHVPTFWLLLQGVHMRVSKN